MLYATHARVHLSAIAANLRAVAAHVGPRRRILMPIKADAYGHGAAAVGRYVAEHALAHSFGVATVPEAIELREAGIDLPILKLSMAFPEELGVALAHDVTLTVVDEDTARQAQDAAARTGRVATVHLKVDTGMRRIGCPPEQAGPLSAYLVRQCPQLRLEGIFTHLPASDTPSEEAFTAHQLRLFARARADAEAAAGRRLLAHAANSGGVLAHPDAWLDMVRPGVMLYGSYPDPAVPRTVPLVPALTWESRVSFVKDVGPGESVGYGRTWTAAQARRLATVPVGYGDGYDRHLSNRGEVLIAGRRHPIVGRVCMDQLMVDLGSSESARARQVAVGDPVTLIGRDGAEEITASDVAAALGTIPYEVTCRIAARVPRLYDD